MSEKYRKETQGEVDTDDSINHNVERYLDARPIEDAYVTRRSNSSMRVEQQPVESGNEEIGSSMQKNCIELVKCGGHIWKHKQARGNSNELRCFLRTY